MFMFCVSFIDVFCGLFYGVPKFSVGVFYIFHLFFELGCIRRVCIRTFAVIEREVRAVSHNGYRQALRFFVRAKRVTYRRPACNYRRTGSRRRLHRYRRFRRTRLPFPLVQRCRRRRLARSLCKTASALEEEEDTLDTYQEGQTPCHFLNTSPKLHQIVE